MKGKNSDKKIVCLAVKVGLCVLLVWALTFFLFFLKGQDVRGQFGDMFGAVNALFSGLAFAGLILTLILQKQELGLQRDELEQTRDELENQRKEFETQNKTLKRQQFESALYNMLQLQQQIVSDLAYDTKEGEYNKPWAHSEWSLIVKGRDLFRFSYEKKIHYYWDGPDDKLVQLTGIKGVLAERGLTGYVRCNTPTFFDHYFQHLYRILCHIENNVDLSFEEKYNYVSEIRSTLSRYELVWIYYNILANKEFVEFKRLVEDYALLNNLNESFLTLSLENAQIVQNKGKAYFEQSKFSMSDYEFFLTDIKGDPSKFYVGAFYGRGDIQEGLQFAKECKKIIEAI